MWWCPGNNLTAVESIGSNKWSSYMKNYHMAWNNSGTPAVTWTTPSVIITSTGLKYTDPYLGNPVGWMCAGYWKSASNIGDIGHDTNGAGTLGIGTGPNHATTPNVGPGYWHNKSSTFLHLDSSAKTYSFEAATAMANNTKISFVLLRKN